MKIQLVKKRIDVQMGNWMVFITLLVNASVHGIFAQDDVLKPESSWKVPTDDEIIDSFQGWLDEIQATDADRRTVLSFLNDKIHNRKNSDTIDLVLQTIGQLRPDVQQFTQDLSASTNKLDPTMLESFGDQPFVLDHVRLLVARHFVQCDLHDEAIDLFSKLSLSRVLDPASFLFYKSVAEHQLILKEACLESAEKLLENESELPLRYVMLGKLMVADIKPLKEDSLDEIARLMYDIERRQQLYRAGMRVRGEEEEVIRKLDKLIDQIQQQRQNMQQQQSSQQNDSNKPMDDSRAAGGQGQGETQSKSLSDGGDWGNIPQKDRAAALAEMSKDLPPHYRAVIEEYFRKLANDEDK